MVKLAVPNTAAPIPTNAKNAISPSGDWFSRSGEGKIYERCIYYDNVNTCYSLVWRD